MAVREQISALTPGPTAPAGVSPQQAAVLTQPHGWALFLDIDGTLIDVAPTPEQVFIPKGLPLLLTQLHEALGGALALVTGRDIAAVDKLFGPLRFATSGVHGTVLREHPDDAFRQLVAEVPGALLAAVKEVARFSQEMRVEHKHSGLAVHFRKQPDAAPRLEAELHGLLRRWPTYELRHGRMVLEIVPRGYSKGGALASFLRHPPFAGRRPVVIGDDVGDDPALRIAREVGGVGLTVAGEHFAAAQADFADTAAVRDFLARFLLALRHGSTAAV